QHGRYLGIRLGPAAEMRQLGEDEAVVAVHGVGDLPVAGNDGVVVVGDLLPGRRRRRRMHARGPAEDREGAPAQRLRLMVAREPRRRPAALGHGLGVPGGVDPVLEGDGAHPDRREERAKLVGHGRSLPTTGRLPPVIDHCWYRDEMGDNSAIEWTDATWNPVTGCTKVSPGCKNCYAERLALRLRAMGNPRYRDVFAPTLHPDQLTLPLRW